MEKRECSCIVGRNVNWYSHYGRWYGESLKGSFGFRHWSSLLEPKELLLACWEYILAVLRGSSRGQCNCQILSHLRPSWLLKWIILVHIFLFSFFQWEDFPGGSDGKASVYNVRDLGSIPGLGRSPGEGNGNPLQYYCLENPMDRGTWKATYSPWGRKESDMTEWLDFLSFT